MYIRSRIVALLVVATLQAGCAVALGPGFGHAARQVAVGVGPAEPPQVHLRVTDQLLNVGNRDLAYLDVDLPADSAAGLGHLTVHADGSELQASLPRPGGPWRIRFDPPWAPGQHRTVIMDYDLQPEFSNRGLIAATTDGFYIADRSALPAWLPPIGIFAKGDPRARAESIEVTAPADFRVLAAGRERRTVRNGGVALHQFRMSAADLSAYVIAGRYQERRVETSHGKVVFWTFQPLDAQQAQIAAERLAATAETYRQLFGRVAVRSWLLHIVETASPALPLEATDSGISAASFPQGVLLDRRSIAQIGQAGKGAASEAVLERAEYELARNWFGWQVLPSPESQILLGRGISLYAVARAAAARGGEVARRDAIARLLADYDSARLRGQDGALLKLPVDSTPEQRTTYAYRAALFLVALEDLAGRENFDHALRRVLNAMAGKEIDADELRSAVEAATGRDFAATFRGWLNRPGIPDDFRTRYAVDREPRSSVSEVASGDQKLR